MVHISGCKDKGNSLDLKNFTCFFSKKRVKKRAERFRMWLNLCNFENRDQITRNNQTPNLLKRPVRKYSKKKSNISKKSRKTWQQKAIA